ncbi:hypothetical protein R1sor_015543 [Riccia sorocarpa]|uniref:Glycosyltransferase n=1 Tax=Riccia sorocarpa TaxID=122646 RepID=A0ABD3HFI3_9MARC
MGPLSESKGNAETLPSVWIVPYSFPSHVKCFLQFAKLLASHKMRVTFLCIKGDVESLGLHAMLESWRSEGLEIQLRDLEIQEPNSCDRRLWVVQQQEARFDIILQTELRLGLSKPTVVISDFWLPGIHESAVKWSIPAWVFSILSLGYTGSAVYLSQLQSKGILKLPASPSDTDSQEHISLPGLPLLPIRELDALSAFSGHVFYPLGRRNGLALPKSEVVILSTFKELEPRGFRELELLLHNAAVNLKDKRNLKTGDIYTVGPIFPLTAPGARSTGSDSYGQERHPCLKFLDGQRDSSVLFVAFGTSWHLAPEQMQEIALGLECSEQPFLCAFHLAVKTAQYPTGNIFDVIPPDCVIRTKERGLFVEGWVPQLQILNHPAVGGFLSHCGHNSVLESLSMGVPLLAWPSFVDQMMNARYAVEEIQVGLQITKDQLGEELVDRKEVERKTRSLFHSEEGKAARKNARQIRELALQTVAENGSSYMNVQALIARIRVGSVIRLMTVMSSTKYLSCEVAGMAADNEARTEKST